MKKKLKILPLGGLGEIGMNLMVLQYGTDAIAIDFGIMFSDENLPGIDLIVPDFTYLLNEGITLHGIILTHGHEDHIGALPFFLRERLVPIYGSKFTLALVRKKLTEFDLIRDVKIHLVKEGDRQTVGPFEIEFIQMAHSIADALGVAIRTPEGLVLHTGDFKIDLTPVDGRTTDMERFKKLGDEGVFLLLSDSTNVEIPGPTLSEQTVRKDLERLVTDAPGWVVLACFASHIPRLRQVFDIAVACGKKVHIAGRSMIQNVGIGRELGYLKFPDNVLIDLDQVERTPRSKLILLSTGTQGEVRSALARMALDQHKELKIRPGDRVVLSSRFIPGNEQAIYSVIDHLYRRGAEVVTSRIAHVHVSGHACRGDLEQVIRAVRPKYFIPVHGEYRHLHMHCIVAQESGVPPDQTFLLEDGFGVEFLGGSAKRLSPIDLRESVVDGNDLVEIGSAILKDRKQLAATGMVVAIVIVDRHSGELIQGPELFTKGLLDENLDADLLSEAREDLLDRIADLKTEVRTDDLALQEEIRLSVRRFFKHKIDRKPVVIPVVLEV